MKRLRHPSGTHRIARHRAYHHERTTATHRKNPCPHSPRTLDADTELGGTFVRHPGRKRHNPWTAELTWPEVAVDTDGFPIRVEAYGVRFERTANGTDWFLDSKHVVPGKRDVDADDEAKIVIHHLAGNIAYRFQVQPRGVNCDAEWSDYFDLGTPDDAPPAPNDVTIQRASIGIKGAWAADPDEDDDREFDKRISHFLGELWLHNEFDDGHEYAFTATASDDKITISTHGFANGDAITLHRTIGGAAFPGGLKPWRCLYVRDVTTNTFKVSHRPGGTAINITSNGDGTALWGLVRTARHIHKHQHVFEIHPDDFSENQRFYFRVQSVSDHGAKSAFIPGTGIDSGGNDDPDATAAGRRPAWPRHVFKFTIPGDVEAKLYLTPDRVDDDYRVRRVTANFHFAGSGGATLFDIKLNAGSFLFDGDTGSMTTIPSGDHDGSSNMLVNSLLERGDNLRVKCESTGSTPPSNGTVHVICDRIDDGSTSDSGGGGGE